MSVTMHGVVVLIHRTQPPKTKTICKIKHINKPVIRFTDNIKDGLVKQVRDSLGIEGMNSLYKQITRNGKTNYNRDKDGFFFQAQITKQLKAKGYDITRVENSGFLNGSKYDIDIILDDCIYIQSWFGGNVFGYKFDKVMRLDPAKPQYYSLVMDWDKDKGTLVDKLNQLNKPDLEGRVHKPIKILVVASPTRLPHMFLPEWNVLLKDKTVIELRGEFDDAKNLTGLATLHRLHTRDDGVAKGIIRALGFRYMESFNALDAGRRLCGLLASPWQSSYLNTASQSILLRPKCMAETVNPSIVAGWYVDSTGHEPPPTFVRGVVNDFLQYRIGQVVWADMEQHKNTDSIIYNPDNFESMDRLIANQEQARNSLQIGLYSAYNRKLDRDKTDVFDATVVDACHGHLELNHVSKLLNGIMNKSGKRPEVFCGDPAALWQLLEIGLTFGCYGEVFIPYNKMQLTLPSFAGIPTSSIFNETCHYKPGCIFAINFKDEHGVRSGLRLLGSSYSETEMRLCGAYDNFIAYVVGETAVDPRACGKIVNIEE